jgi:hypothetical protein
MGYSIEYLAGFFDGEGSISLHEIRAKVRIRVGQVVEEPLQRYVNVFGGKIHFNQITLGGLPYFVYDTNDSVRCGKILTELYPYLLVKQVKAQVALERLELPVPASNDNVSLEYLAGFFDAEGSVSTCRKSLNKLDSNIRVRQNEQLPLLMFQQMFGGYIIKSKGYTQAGNETFEWKLKQSNIVQFCDVMISRVLVKREHLILIKKLVSIRLSNNGCDPRIEEKFQLADKIYRLNGMGHLKVV